MTLCFIGLGTIAFWYMLGDAKLSVINSMACDLYRAISLNTLRTAEQSYGHLESEPGEPTQTDSDY